MEGRDAMHVRQSSGSAKAFTLIELLVVITIITVLISILLPALRQARERAYGVVCMSRMKQIHVAATSYGNDFGAIPGALSYENEKTAGVSLPSKFMYSLTSKAWTRGPGFIVKTMATGYLPRDKRVAWCPSKDPAEGTSGTHFWGKDIDDQFWGLNGAVYGGIQKRFTSVWSSADADQYWCGGAIPLRKWDKYNKAAYVTESAGSYSVTSAAHLDPGLDATRAGRHLDSLHVMYPPGQVVLMERLTIANLLSNNDPEFCWGD
jgi:prepilin-type N-terminal cleavage/methylation domain-containing protein